MRRLFIATSFALLCSAGANAASVPSSTAAVYDCKVDADGIGRCVPAVAYNCPEQNPAQPNCGVNNVARRNDK